MSVMRQINTSTFISLEHVGPNFMAETTFLATQLGQIAKIIFT